MSVEFSRSLIKGRIAEVIFEQMIRDEGEYTVIPFGYEHTMPMLAQHRHLVEIARVMDNIADAPDFALISQDKTKVFLVEVKYKSNFDPQFITECATKLLDRWNPSWLFVATPHGFYASPCNWIAREHKILPLTDTWVKRSRQSVYLQLMNEFENHNTASHKVHLSSMNVRI